VKHLAGKVVECSTQGRRSGRYRVVFNSDGDAMSVETIVSPISRRKLWRLSDDKEPSITACCAIRAAIAALTHSGDEKK
jgi:hypothetical protein